MSSFDRCVFPLMTTAPPAAPILRPVNIPAACSSRPSLALSAINSPLPYTCGACVLLGIFTNVAASVSSLASDGGVALAARTRLATPDAVALIGPALLCVTDRAPEYSGGWVGRGLG